MLSQPEARGYSGLSREGSGLGEQATSAGERIRAARSDAGQVESLLGPCRNYLWLLARTSVSGKLQAKLDASDVVQETLLKACDRFDQFRGHTEGELLAWLRSILARTVANLARGFAGTAMRDLGRERSLERAFDRSSDALAGRLASPGTSPSRAAERGDLRLRVADALATLDPDHREVIVLRNFEELPWEEVARRMDRSSGAVRMLWLRAIRRLGPIVEELG